jgi:hypothetical protein
MIVEALKFLRPGANWSLSGDALSGLVWLDANQTRPTDAEILATAAALHLPQMKARLVAQVNEDAENCRLQYITPGAGMAMTYQEKFSQAQAVDALGQATANALTPEERAAQYPTLSASVGLEAATLWDCAQLVITRYEAFAALSAVIETARIGGKLAISNASDAAAAQAAYEAITWPSP